VENLRPVPPGLAGIDSSNMRVEIEENERTLYVRLLDPRLEGDNQVSEALIPYKTAELDRVEIDFRLVEYMNSRGITELVTIYRTFDPQRTKLRFLNVRGRVRHVMDLVELHHIAEIQGD
jgi:anti-anti-sigma factor